MIGLTQQEQVEFERIKDEMWDYGYEAAKEEFGWHPASKLPVIPEGKFSVHVIAYCCTPSGIYAPIEVAYTRTGGWQYESVKWWCYPPGKEK